MRSFVALRFGPDAENDIARIQSMLPHGRALPPQNLHLTLAFLDEQTEEALEAVAIELDRLQRPALALRFHGIGVFGTNALGLVCVPDPALDGLQAGVTRALRRAGLRIADRRFRPHLTLRRLPGGQMPPQALLSRDPLGAGPLTARALTLEASTLRPDGPRYDTLAAWPLG
jgi:2'-5' RNA ligase